MSNSDRNRLGNCWKSYLIYFVCRISKEQKKIFLIINTKGLQREWEVPKYTKCICDHQTNAECTLQCTLQSFDFTKSVNKLSMPILIYHSYKNSLNNRKVGKSRSIILYRIGDAMIAHWFLKAWAWADAWNENAFPPFPQFVERSFHSAIAGDYVAIIARKTSPEIFPKCSWIFSQSFPELLKSLVSEYL